MAIWLWIYGYIYIFIYSLLIYDLYDIYDLPFGNPICSMALAYLPTVTPINDPVLKVNILYMEHMGMDNTLFSSVMFILKLKSILVDFPACHVWLPEGICLFTYIYIYTHGFGDMVIWCYMVIVLWLYGKGKYGYVETFG